MSDFLYPPRASTFAGEVDALMNYINYLSIFFWVLITGLILYFAWRYRNGNKEVGPSHNTALEITWTVIPTILVISIFVWGFKTYMTLSRAPGDAMDVYVTGQKWSWSFEYPEHGVRTTNELVVPVNQPVRLVMQSSDVIHSMWLPAFRNKMDVLPGRTTTVWFEATEEGTFRFYCTEYCGDAHWNMKGDVKVVSAEAFHEWIEEKSKEDTTTPLPELGAKLFQSKACFTCHTTDGTPSIGPTLKGVFGRTVELADGKTVEADEDYLRESILQPGAKIVKGFAPTMPSFQGQLSERELNGLIEYIKSLK